jgi:hypothetical protein
MIGGIREGMAIPTPGTGWDNRKQAIVTTRVARAAELQIQFFTRRYRDSR